MRTTVSLIPRSERTFFLPSSSLTSSSSLILLVSTSVSSESRRKRTKTEGTRSLEEMKLKGQLDEKEGRREELARKNANVRVLPDPYRSDKAIREKRRRGSVG